MRRIADVVAAALIALLALPLLAGAALLIRWRLGSPVLFRQQRSGLRGDEFTILKFRTMRPERAPDEPDQRRIPRVGRLLRATSLDELPQLWNVLRGDMSIIGPRPTLPEQVLQYTDRQRGRLAIRPGLTGWAQVNGRNGISWPERIELDLWYIERRSVWLDVRIIGATLIRLLRPDGIVGEGGVNPGFPVAAGVTAPDA